MMTTLLHHARSRPELIIVCLMVMIIAMLIVPLPTHLVDFLIALNIVIAILLFMGSFYIDRILSFSTFPTILLITTLFRLALSISTSRLVLTQADAGEIITTFGEYVIGESLVVGFVIFSIVMIVQFIVITKGSERVAEVAARFSLDGMPGKQMSIDGDLKAGVIDADGARERRSILERESQLYGSFDGAMKFIKGDAIAGIIITFVNLIGGIAVGVGSHGMDMSTAVSTYTVLTIGDGLVAQIPALLIAISAGFIVTRINGDGTNLGQNIMSQMFGMPFAVGITAALAVLVAFLPGFPAWVFVLLSIVLGGFLYLQHRKTARDDASGTGSGRYQNDANAPESQELGMITDVDSLAPETIAFILLTSPSQIDWFMREQIAARIRSQFFVDYGVKLPEVAVRMSDATPADHAMLLINEVRTERLHVRPGMLKAWAAADYLQALQIEAEPAVGGDDTATAWVDMRHRQQLDELGIPTKTAADELYRGVVSVLVRMVPEYFGIQETKKMLDHVEADAPDLLREVMRNVTVQKISEVLQRLLAERISIRNFKLILEALAQWGSREKDVIVLVEHVRGAMARYITDKFAVADQLRVIMLGMDMEEAIRRSIRQNSSGAYLNVEPSLSEQILDQLSILFGNTSALSPRNVVLLTSVDVRRFVKRLIEQRFRNLDVMSFAEVAGNAEVCVIKTLD
ncbi:type III secretion protein V [Cupriavidus sp. YR651]|uniref:EscV/YscV/HrcV family type III secretion system export apparatus protein n=1 Tax=Cupriavidus sp. YR651 TaxID=1855315 RepID=UPI00088C57B1|nr:EscV/YscV/HrcV family type III secretion system export apparatus protein [Cupriavidus sp. YR651]SDD38767.1 type III secretion protein V [Cupriavidus sp. YR651]